MLRNCLECGVEFQAARDTARFHNASCRVKYSRRDDKLTKVGLPVVHKTEELPDLKPGRLKVIPALRMQNKDFIGRMVFGGTVKQKRITYMLPDGLEVSLPYTD